MSIIRKNIIANMVGNGWAAILAVALIPLYIHLMGIESYALVGFFAAMQSVFLLLDIGLAATITREIARLSTKNNSEKEKRNLLRTLEIVYWILAIIVLILIINSAPWISTKWLSASQLSPETIERAVSLMGWTIAARMPLALYYGALQGMQRQVLQNTIKVILGTIQHVGVVIFLWLTSPTIESFFLWQAVTGVLGAGFVAVILWSCLGGNQKARFEPYLFSKLWRFASSMGVISILSTMALQLDKLVLSKMLTLEKFGYYALASSLAMGLSVIVSPIFTALYPRFTQLVAANDETSLRYLYHKSCQLVTVVAIPVALVISFYSLDILKLWTFNDTISEHSSLILSILIAGSAVNSLMNIPYALQLAYGWTTLTIYTNSIAIAVLVPMLVIMVAWYGAVGAAAFWVALNVGILTINMPIIHKKLLKGELSRWLVFDLVLPGTAALLIVSISWLIFPPDLGVVGQIGWIGFVLIASLSASLVAAPLVRKSAWGIVKRMIALRFA